MFLLIFARIRHPIGIYSRIGYLDENNFTEYIQNSKVSVIFFGDKTEDLDFALFGVNKNQDYINFSLADKNISKQYRCAAFPCIIPFKNGERLGIDKAPHTAVAFAHWLDDIKSNYQRKLRTPEELRLLFDATRSVVIAVDAEKPIDYPQNTPIYFATREIFQHFNITVNNGIHCYNPIFRTLDETDNVFKCINQSVIHPKGVRLTERKFLAGYFTDPINTTMNDEIYSIVKKLSELPEYSDFWFTAVVGGRSSAYLAEAGRFSRGVPPFFFVLNTSDLKYTQNRWCLTKEHQKFNNPFIKEFLANVSKGTQPYSLLSEPIPKRDQFMPNLVRAVTDNLDDIVLENGTDVLLTVTASWCAHCHQFIPVLNQLANYVEKRAKIVYIDSELNELPPVVPDFSGYPSVFFYPAYNKTAIQYKDKRDIDSLLSFLGKNVKEPFDPENMESDYIDDSFDNL
jgi:thiol-disulfide isomerase/thioredoxin